MANLKSEYLDIKDIKHKVEHLIMSSDDKNSKERIIEELFSALARSSRHIPT